MPAPEVTFGCTVGAEGNWNLAELARRAEELGYDRIAAGEHVMDGNPPRPTLMSIPAMAAAAGATRNLRVMTGILLAPLYHPVMLAKLTAALDVVSAGRLDLGIGVGGQRDSAVEFEALGVPVRTRGRRADEVLQALKRLWTEDHVTHQGRFFNFDDVTLLPRPAQQPHPPVWVAGRSDAAMRRAALIGDGWYPYLFSLRRLRTSNEKVRAYAAEAGRDLAGFHWSINQPTVIGESPQEALAMAASNLGRRYVTADRSAEDIARSLCVTGTPGDCVKALEDRIDAGTRNFNLTFLSKDIEGLSDQMEVFARRVMPHFRP